MLSLVWMRRDLRLNDHAALATALAEAGPVQPVFVFDTDILARFTNPRDRRLTFIADALCHIDSQLRARGGQLLVLHGVAAELMPRLAEAVGATGIFSAEDFEPATRARDAAVKAALPPGTRFVQVLDHLMVAPQRAVKADGTPYKVFTPYYKNWRTLVGPMELAVYDVKDQGRYAGEGAVAAAQKTGVPVLSLAQGPAALLQQIGYEHVADSPWRVEDVDTRLANFIDHKLAAYPTARDQLPINGTSQLSPYLRHGLVSIRACMRAAMESGRGDKWISELAWREFYATILFHFPHVVAQEFMLQYRAIPWSDDPALIAAFTEGRTGYPVVDAAVHELLRTGYMHNRARMIVASFVTKDLLLDWRIGEEFFAQHLMDYDLASNNGGWQWAASTGTDAAPYFRVFNPILQSRKFDPAGEYIRRYVPVLAEMSDKDIHAPWESPFRPRNYSLPIVDHAQAKQRVVDLFRRAGHTIS